MGQLISNLQSVMVDKGQLPGLQTHKVKCAKGSGEGYALSSEASSCPCPIPWAPLGSPRDNQLSSHKAGALSKPSLLPSQRRKENSPHSTFYILNGLVSCYEAPVACMYSQVFALLAMYAGNF